MQSNCMLQSYRISSKSQNGNKTCKFEFIFEQDAWYKCLVSGERVLVMNLLLFILSNFPRISYLYQENRNLPMKQIFTILLLIFSVSICYAQDAVYLVSNPQNAKWSYIETDNNGKHISTIYNSVESIEGDAVNGNMKLRVEEVHVVSPKDTITSFMFYRFKDGELMVDVCAQFEDTVFDSRLDSLVRSTIKQKFPDLSEEKMREVIEQTKSEFLKMSGEVRGIPRYPKVGKLPDYEFRINVSLISMKVMGEDRRIVGRERINTQAGSFDCFILEETISTKSMMMKDVEKIKSWYAYGIGLVKEITYDKHGKLVSTMILNDIS